MNVLTPDWEVTTHSKGNPFDRRNYAVCLGYKHNGEDALCTFTDLSMQHFFNGYDLAVFFNAKFDLHWFRKQGITLPLRVWCCQVAEFILSGQTIRYPSLEDTAVKYELGHKIDVIKLEYWDKGIQTDEIPQDILAEYCKQDVDLTYQIYLKQLEQFKEKPALYQLFKLQMQDLLVLEEMEWNGQLYNEELCKQREQELNVDITRIKQELAQIYPDIPINFGSGPQLSAFLYGGKIPYVSREHVGFYKNGKPKYKNVDKEYVLPRLIEPLKGSEIAKDGYFKTDEDTLRKLKGPAAKRFVGPLLKLAELDKLVSTYYRGLHEKNVESCWPKGMIHGQFNQVVAKTGRLSSSNPNLQNFSGDCLDIFISRYDG
jgi:DNA polymerase I-like protein with 3'-5' exonuclease and polymerase domains